LTDWIQALSALAMVLLTFGLVLFSITLAGITLGYAKHTKRMADVMVKEYEAKIAPLVDGPFYSWMHGPEEAKCLLKLGNIGQTPFMVKDCEITSWHKDTPDHRNTKLFEIDKVLEAGTKPDVVKTLKYKHNELLSAGQLDTRKLKDCYRGKLYYFARVRVYSALNPSQIHTITSEPKLAFPQA